MQIDIKQTPGGSFIVQLGETMARLDADDLKALAAAVERAQSPGVKVGRGAMRTLVDRLATADDVGVQILIGKADHDDIVALLKAAESSKATLKKLFSNMSANNRKVCIEDLAFRFRSAPPNTVMAEAAERLIAQIHAIEADGVRLFSR